MSKGTASFGKHHKKTHIICRRCGHRSYHVNRKVCGHCWFGKSPRRKKVSWLKRRSYPKVVR